MHDVYKKRQINPADGKGERRIFVSYTHCALRLWSNKKRKNEQWNKA